MGFLSNWFGRGGRIFRGKMNRAMDTAEDATFESTVRQTVHDMRTELNKAINASAAAMSNHNRLEADFQRWVRQSEEWRNRAGVALDAGNEELARKALAKKAECDQQVEALRPAIEQARAASETLKQQVAELKKRLEDADRAATTLVARRNAAKAQRKVAEALSGVGEADNAFAALKGFEESVARDEAAAKAFATLAATGKADDLEAEFAALQGSPSGSVEAELEALKRERSGA